MGIFDFIKKKSKSKPENNLYETDEWKKLLSEIRDQVFKNEEEIIFAGDQIIIYSNKKLSLEKAKFIYVKARVRLFLSIQRDINEMFEPKFEETLKMSIKVDSNNILSEKEIDDIFKFCIYKTIPALAPHNLNADKVINFLSGNEYNDGCSLDEIPWGKGEFGYNMGNPIPVSGVISNNIYLDKLRDQNNEQVTWERIGSFAVENIKHPVDGYKIFNKGGNLISVIYISSYHKKISDRAPSGYILTK